MRSADVGRLDVLDEEDVGAALAALLEVVDEALERPARGAHALDRQDLRVDREDRLDLQRRADPRLRAADAPAAAQVLERVDREQICMTLAELARARRRLRHRRRRPRPRSRRRCAIKPWPAQPVAESTTSIRAGSTPRSISWSRACSAARTVPEMPPDRWIETMSSPRSISGSYTARKSPSDGCEVLGQRARTREVLVERVEVRRSRPRAPCARPSSRTARRCGCRGARPPRAGCNAWSRTRPRRTWRGSLVRTADRPSGASRPAILAGG